MSTRRVLAFCCGLVLLPMMHWGSFEVAAQSEVQQLQSQIAEKNNRLAEIEREIAEYSAALNEVGAERQTLQSAINQLDLERKKVTADISYTQNLITSSDLTINKLTLEISDTERNISESEEAIAQIIRNMYIADNESMVEILLRHENISEFWGALETLDVVKNSMRERVQSLDNLKLALESKRELTTEEREQLVDLQEQYNDQNSILRGNLNEKAELLDITKNEESNYQSLLSSRESAREQLLAEVRQIESELQFILDPNTIPSPGTPVFMWPVDNPIITQNFGYTKFALSGAYGGSQHNGMDMGAPVGTKIYAPLTGRVRNIGNTDLVPGCYSWGKWLMIDHPNGLSSMFAHLSQISVTPGQNVSTGDVVGYVGNTGYSTGPHLHYTLYVSDAVQVKAFNQFKAVTGCGAALSPFAAVEGYLNPRDYLPAI